MQVAASMAGWAIALVLFLTNLVADGAEVKVENGVLLLEEDNFDIALKKYNALLVFFYSPNVKKSAVLYEPYQKAARKIKKYTNNTARLAKVDVTTDGGRQIPYRYKIMEYPTLVAFREGELLVHYLTMHEKQEFFEFMLAVNGHKVLFFPRYLFLSLRANWKQFMRFTPATKEFRKQSYDVFGVILFFMIAIPLASYWFCCRGMFDSGEQEEEEVEATPVIPDDFMYGVEKLEPNMGKEVLKAASKTEDEKKKE